MIAVDYGFMMNILLFVLCTDHSIILGGFLAIDAQKLPSVAFQKYT